MGAINSAAGTATTKARHLHSINFADGIPHVADQSARVFPSNHPIDETIVVTRTEATKLKP